MTLMKQHQTRSTHNNSDRPKREIIPLEEFIIMLKNNKWIFTADSFYELQQLAREDRKCFDIAHGAGPIYVREYMRFMKQAARSLQLSNAQEVVKEVVVQQPQSSPNESDYFKRKSELFAFTGDPEFDDFRMKLDRHDWYYSYHNERKTTSFRAWI